MVISLYLFFFPFFSDCQRHLKVETVFLDLPLSKVLSGDIKYDINKQWHQLTVQSSGVHPPRHLVFLLHSPSSDHKEAKDFNSKLEAVLEEILTAHTSQGEKAAQGDPNSSATQDASHLQKASVTQAAGIMTEPSYVAVSQIASRQSMSTLQGQPGLPATAVEQTAMALAVAIQMGEVATAEKLAAMLAQGHTNVSVTFDPAAEERRAREQEISVTVHVEDRQSVGLTLDDIKVRASDTILDLKRQFLGKYNFPVEVQKWIIGRRIPGDEETLSKCDVTTPGHTLYLYLLNARAANLSRDDGKRHRQGQISSDYETMNPPLTAMRGVQASVTTPMSGPDQDPTSQMVQGGPLGTGGANRQQSQLSAASSTASLGAASFALSDFRANLEPGSGPNSGSRGSEGRGGSPGAGKGGLAEGGGVAQSLLTAGGGRAVDTHTLQAPPQDFTLNQELGWSCPQCTFINQPTRPGCEICGSPRPTDYQVPSDVIVSDEERDRLAREQQMEVYLQQAELRERETNYQRLVQADSSELVSNSQPFTCPICFDDIDAGQGVVLRDCLHQFCRSCLTDTVRLTEEAVLKCPYQDDSYKCDALLQDRDVRALVPEQVYEKYLRRSLDVAESQASNSYHCKTPDCRGWCLYEDLVNFFRCPVCQQENCLTCRAIHQGMNCKQYQDDLRIRAANDKAALQTQVMLQEMLDKGEAMPCPQCEVIVQKKDGCDWIRCSICKTEICWVTKGPRWGPKGEGDTSGGCKCRVGGHRCHPKCNNCH
ncbi:ranBP-type and C3HC4-type zinc finger-containing protein 1-like isoform X2 [Babylonia areolata]|uniref:ranBP-type and C3HC4-type zinc finger-containing protein 1-like isoform X2 n=1 Tax=Babylonia areolata TaxID=304850 RepID=UPI003FD267AD